MTKLLIAAGALAMSATMGLAQDYSAPYTSYFAFGDSLTDDGKFGQLAPPSLGGRFSNGITYAEHIAADFQADNRFTFNFALGGATAEDDNENVPFYPAEALPFATFGTQVASFSGLKADVEGSGIDLGETPLVSVLFGGNDLLQDLGDSLTVGADAADAVKAGIEAIAALDPRFDTFVVGNLADLGTTPLFSGSPLQTLATATSAQFNAQLAANIGMLTDNGLNIIELDFAGLTAQILDDPGTFGITNITEPCTPSFNEFTPLDNCAFDLLTQEIDITAADEFFFADNVHPNRVVQSAAADAFRAALTPAPVPLPAGLPLMLAGLGVFGALRLRKSR